MTNPTRQQFTPDIAEYVDEAFERIGIDPAGVAARHLHAARRSMGFMLADWSTKHPASWTLTRARVSLEVGAMAFTLAAGTLDILDAVLVREHIATPMAKISRSDYLAIPDKTIAGRPDRYYVERGVNGAQVLYWQPADRNGDVIDYWAFVAFGAANTATDAPDVPYYFYDAFAAGLAARLAVKFAPDRAAAADAIATRALADALAEGGDRADLRVSVAYGR